MASCLLEMLPMGLLAAGHCGLACPVHIQHHLNLGLVLSDIRVQRTLDELNQIRPDCLHVVVKDEAHQALCNGILRAGPPRCQPLPRQAASIARQSGHRAFAIALARSQEGIGVPATYA